MAPGERSVTSLLRAALRWLLDNPIGPSLLALAVGIPVVLLLSWPYYGVEPKSFWQNVLVEAHGLLFDLFVIGIVVASLLWRREKKVRLLQLRQDIEAIRFWQSEEAKFRIVAAAKELSTRGVHGINLSQCYLVNADFVSTDLTGANFMLARCTAALFACANLSEARLRLGQFERASFQDAKLMRLRDCAGANFKEADFRNADLSDADLSGALLRGAANLTVEQLSRCKSLKQVDLDEGVVRALNAAGYGNLL